MLGVGLAFSRCHKCRAQPYGPCPGRCAKKARSYKSHDNRCLKFNMHLLMPLDYLDVNE